jgi:hypothetical protein
MISQRESHNPVRQEMLVRSVRYKSDYHLWLEQQKQVELLKTIYISFVLRKLNIAGDIPLHAYQQNESSNLIVHYIEPIGKNSFNYLFDYLKDRTVKLGYMLYLSDRQIIERNGFIEKVERHLLRPQQSPYYLSENKEQLYGNIALSLIFINDKPLYLKIESSYALEKAYNQAFSFDDFAEVLFG